MKKILLSIVSVCLMAGCSESFLDTDNLIKKDSSNFPVSTEDAEQILTGLYRPAMGNSDVPYANSFFVAEMMSDERFGGGGSDDRDAQAVAAFMKTNENMYSSYWSMRWQGIYRCNFMLKVEEQIAWDSEDIHNRIIGETYFMRAYYYLELARAFGNIPLVLTPDPVNNPQADPADVYGQIASDLLKAIDLMPAKPHADLNGVGTDGHATKWAAQALLARAFLFYTGYYGAESITLPEEGGMVTKADVVAQIDNCIANSGHDLLPEFRNLWPYSAAKDYKYKEDNGLDWVGDCSAWEHYRDNPEPVFVIKHSGNNYTGRNLECLFFSPRYQGDGSPTGTWADCYPFGQGWGGGLVTRNIYDTWPANDPRRTGSILNMDDPAENVTYYDGMQNQVQDTHLFNKKYIAISTKADDPTFSNGGVGTGNIPLYWYLYPEFEAALDYMSNNLQDFFVIRFSDVLLMGAELGSSNAQTYMDRVRARVGLDPVPATLENIKNERRWELAFEGIRYFDLLRWHDEKLITEHRSDVEVYNQGIKTKISVPFRAETKGFLPIPDEEIQRSEGTLVQNAGWASNEGNY